MISLNLNKFSSLIVSLSLIALSFFIIDVLLINLLLMLKVNNKLLD